MHSHSNPDYFYKIDADTNRDGYIVESFVNTTNELIKFFSSIERVDNYTLPKKYQKTGKERPHLELSTFNEPEKKWNYLSPKISRPEFTLLMKDENRYKKYMEQVFAKDADEIIPFDQLTTETIQQLYYKAINSLEKDWNFHRAYYKVFQDVHGEPMFFIDIQAFCATRHVRFMMREAFQYLEGNYVTTLHKESKVYIPHLQFYKDSVELPYSSYLDLSLENIIADYLIKEEIKDIKGDNSLLSRLRIVDKFKADVAKDRDEPVFIRTSSYIDHSKYVECLEEWIRSLDSVHLNLKSRASIVRNVKFDNLKLPSKYVFGTKRDFRKPDDIPNFPTDRQRFYIHTLKHKKDFRWQRRIIRELFRDLIQYSINRFRMKEGSEDRTEYENIFSEYKDMSFYEKDVGCLLVEDGEISTVLLLDRYIKNSKIMTNPYMLLRWGLIEKQGTSYIITDRAWRMAMWCMRMMRLKFWDDKISIDFASKERINRTYRDLVEDKEYTYIDPESGGREIYIREAKFSWMLKIDAKYKDELAKLFGVIIQLKNQAMDIDAILYLFKQICENFLKSNYQKRLDSLTNSRFNKELNEWLRAYESINRSVIAFPVNTIPSRRETRTRSFSIFIGTFQLDDSLLTDSEDEFAINRRKIVNQLNYTKIFYTLIGIPASETLSEAIVRKDTKLHIESALARFSHKVKNEGVNVVERMKGIISIIENLKDQMMTKDVQEFEEAVERLTGSIHILNIASNGLKIDYMEENKYCVLDVILRAYCNAFKQFFTTGPRDERNRFYNNELKSYQIPILQIDGLFSNSVKEIPVQKSYVYSPDVPGITFHNTIQNIEPVKYVMDSQDILGSDAINYVDLLPQKLILISPFLEIFLNALKYMRKETDNNNANILHLTITRDDKNITVELLNPIEPYQKGKELDDDKKNSAGLMANELFFQNIGGDFSFKYKQAAEAKVNINFQRMKEILRGRK